MYTFGTLDLIYKGFTVRLSDLHVYVHRRMGTLWLGGGAEGMIARNFTQITGADTGFPEGGGISQAPPLPWTLSA